MIWKTYYQQIKAANNVISAIEKEGVIPVTNLCMDKLLALRGYTYFMLLGYFCSNLSNNELKDCVPCITLQTIEGKPRAKVEEFIIKL